MSSMLSIRQPMNDIRSSTFDVRSAFVFLMIILGFASAADAQLPNVRYGDLVPRDVREMYDRGLQYLANSQTEAGNWTGGDAGPGVTGLGLMVFLASGEDPNFGLYSNHVRRALRSIISSQDGATGFLGQ